MIDSLYCMDNIQQIADAVQKGLTNFWDERQAR